MQSNKIRIIISVILGCLIFSSASIASSADRLRISVLRVNNNTHAYWWSSGTAADLQDMLMNELSSTRAFHVLTRQEMYSLFEQKFIESISPDIKTKLKTGKIKAAKYFIMMTVSAFEENTNNGSGINFLGFPAREEQKKAYVAVDVKIIDGETGIVIDNRSIGATDSDSFKQDGNHTVTPSLSGSLAKQEKTPVGKAIRNCITATADYLECFLITKDEECLKKYISAENKIKEKKR